MKKLKHIKSINEIFSHDKPELKSGFKLLGKFSIDDYSDFVHLTINWASDNNKPPVSWRIVPKWSKHYWYLKSEYWDKILSGGAELHVVEKGDGESLYRYIFWDGKVQGDIRDNFNVLVEPSEIFIHG